MKYINKENVQIYYEMFNLLYVDISLLQFTAPQSNSHLILFPLILHAILLHHLNLTLTARKGGFYEHYA